MSVYSNLFIEIQKAIFPAYGAFYTSQNMISKDDPDSAKIHSYLILLLEIVSYEYRKQHATIFEPLRGDKALKHLLFTRYQVSLRELEANPLEWIVFALLKDLAPENLPQKAQNYVNGLKLNKDASGIDWNLKVNWILGSGERTLKKADEQQEN
ncbi:ECs1072 family phage-associated protein [Xenorhabdus entomophaga]|uniref:ECs1072 family phage-associated protein n=1 Tax=Xenorhabdus entomophaga TaxID=3136257 RepID=UPI003BF5EC1B